MPLVVFGLHDSREFTRVRRMVSAHGFVSRDASLEELKLAVTEVARGRDFVSPKLAVDMMRRATAASRRRELALTRREAEVAILVAKRLTNRQVGAKLGLSEHTVKIHVRRILTKLHAPQRSDVSRLLLSSSSSIVTRRSL